MPLELAHLTALLDRRNTLIDAAARKVETVEQPVQGAFYAGMMLGMETARDEMAADWRCDGSEHYQTLKASHYGTIHRGDHRTGDGCPC